MSLNTALMKALSCRSRLMHSREERFMKAAASSCSYLLPFAKKLMPIPVMMSNCTDPFVLEPSHNWSPEMTDAKSEMRKTTDEAANRSCRMKKGLSPYGVSLTWVKDRAPVGES